MEVRLNPDSRTGISLVIYYQRNIGTLNAQGWYILTSKTEIATCLFLRRARPRAVDRMYVTAQGLTGL